MIAEAMPLITKLLFLAVGLGLVTPALYNVFKASNASQRRYDRYRNRNPKPVGQRRYDRLWVVDRDDNESDV